MLDASRGLACIGVVAMHCHLDYAMPWYWGVMDFFFVMSGLLITRSLISNCDKGRGTASFLLYRALRLLPAYLTVILLYALAVLVMQQRTPGEILPYVFLYQHTDLIFGQVEIFPRIYELLPYWSLILEEHYYILWGVLFCVFAYAKLRINSVSLAVIACLFGVALVLRKAGVSYWTLPGRFDGFLAGSIAGIIIFMPRKVSISDQWAARLIGLGWLLSLVALARLVWSGYNSYCDQTRFLAGIWLDVTCYTIVSVVLVLGLVKIDIRGIHFGRLQNGLAFLGLISYEIYLAHFPIVTLLTRAYNFNFHNGALLLFPLTMFLSSVVAYFMHRMLTAPALKRREDVYSFFTKRFSSQGGNLQGEPSPIPVESGDGKIS